MNRLAGIFGLLLVVVLMACQSPTPTPTAMSTPPPTAEPPTPAPTVMPTNPPTAEPSMPTSTATPEPTATPTVSAGAAAYSAYMEMLEEAPINLSAETKACLMDLFEEDPSVAESFTTGEDLSGPAMLSFMACLTPEEAATLTSADEDPPPDTEGLACLTEELEGALEKDRILAVLSGADTSGEGLTLEESAVLGEAVEVCGIDTDFSFPGGESDEGNPLAFTEWRLVELSSADAPAQVVGDDVTARFTTDVDMTGWTGCNSYGAIYSVQGEELRLDDLTWTEAGCPSDELFQQEQRMQDSLATVERFEIAGERLTIHSEGGQALVFERAEK